MVRTSFYRDNEDHRSAECKKVIKLETVQKNAQDQDIEHTGAPASAGVNIVAANITRLFLTNYPVPNR